MRAAAGSGPTRAMTIWFFGTFTISCSTPVARKAGTLTLRAGCFHMPTSYRRYPLCGLVGLGRKSICVSSPAANPPTITPFAKLLRQRHSTRSFDDQRPITIAELARLLDGTARVVSKFRTRLDLLGARGPLVTYAPRLYPSAGGGHELELYLAIDQCHGLARGFYHYDAGAHALVRIAVPASALDTLLTRAKYAMGVRAAPQIVITITARFGRISWKYSSIAHALILKDVGVLMQTLYLMATDMGLSGCAIGSTDIELFAKMTGIEFHVEGPVGQFALGRARRTRVAG